MAANNSSSNLEASNMMVITNRTSVYNNNPQFAKTSFEQQIQLKDNDVQK